MANKTSTGSKVVEFTLIGAGIAGLAAAAYFFLGPKGKKNQKYIKAWAIKMKGDVVEKLEMAKDITEPIYHEIISSVAAEYIKGKKASEGEVSELASDLKKHWTAISKLAKAGKKDVVKGAKKAVKTGKKIVKEVISK